ncbi:nucleotidyl transferase AbiEii/AbiGii toxin family protein [Candidatus Roizmanbacteria bacterium]|nr:nucleotidyl transferase AbiEii/AbiGii toxin family protein [Candidatus Roizmanbacteria bacterium]
MNKNISNLHLDILDKERQALLHKLLPFAKEFVLGGGTALALQLRHRESYDFDFFSKNPIPKNFLEKISQVITIENIAVDSPDELTFFTKENIKITFLCYPFNDLYEYEELEEGLRLFSVKDIAIKKAYTIGRRGEYRDYFDLYTILKREVISLTNLVLDTKKIYGSIFEEKIFLQQLVYFDDLLNFEIIPVNQTSLPKPEEVKKFFETLVSEYTK